MPYPGHSWRGDLPLCRDAVSVFYNPSQLVNYKQGLISIDKSVLIFSRHFDQEFLVKHKFVQTPNTPYSLDTAPFDFLKLKTHLKRFDDLENIKRNSRMSQKFCNILVAYASLQSVYHLPKQFKPWEVQALVGSLVIAGAQTCCALLYSVCVNWKLHRWTYNIV